MKMGSEVKGILLLIKIISKYFFYIMDFLPQLNKSQVRGNERKMINHFIVN